MIGKAPVTENIIFILSGMTDALDLLAPKSRKEWRERDLAVYYRNRSRMKGQKSRERRRINRAIKNLKQAEAITLDKQNKKFKLTPKGWLKFLQYYSKHEKELKTKEKSKGEYLIIFDIPEKHRRFRNLFRTCLQNLGCDTIQLSVFHTQNREVFTIAQRIVSNCDLDGHVKFIEAKKIY